MLYLETSALLKNYWLEPGTEAVQKLLLSGRQTTTSILARFEVETTLGRLLREGKLPMYELHRQREALLEDWHHTWVVGLDDRVMAQLREIVVRRPLRAGDAIHLASALVVAAAGEPLVFCSADMALLRSASAEGLSTWSPLAP